MLIETLKLLFIRDLDKLRTEIMSYKEEKNLWKVEEAISNSAGNLCLHLVGNLNGFIGSTFGQTGYIRHRDLEFSQKDTPRTELITAIENTKTAVVKGLDSLSPEKLKEDFPIQVWENKTSVEYMMVHLIAHLDYHLGQVNYHRRLLDL